MATQRISLASLLQPLVGAKLQRRQQDFQEQQAEEKKQKEATERERRRHALEMFDHTDDPRELLEVDPNTAIRLMQEKRLGRSDDIRDRKSLSIMKREQQAKRDAASIRVGREILERVESGRPMGDFLERVEGMVERGVINPIDLSNLGSEQSIEGPPTAETQQGADAELARIRGNVEEADILRTPDEIEKDRQLVDQERERATKTADQAAARRKEFEGHKTVKDTRAVA
ncbi:MAG: hypothetical protein OEM91_16885, partial [Hyphomicrobiales bacterium]|nr:hypothetical protein [Hyphomicrobiales bacterium]